MSARWLWSVLLVAACDGSPPPHPGPNAFLGQAPSGFAQALQARAFSFPRDHGAHRQYRSEWWYVTGNLVSGDRPFGYQLTIFRFALTPGGRAQTDWAAGQLFMAHLAVSDIDDNRFHSAERFSREALDLAGAADDRLSVWVEDWSMRGGDRLWPIVLSANDDSFGLELTLMEGKSPILQGQDGLSRKSAQPGNASYYYSLPRIRTEGRIRIRDHVMAVTGTSWLDREWSTSALDVEQVGWDWFAIQLSDQRELMLYRLRDTQGRAHPFSAGVWITADGQALTLRASDFDVQVEDYWRSPNSGVNYPSAWRLRVPNMALDLRILPRLADQEWRSLLTYWEGSVVARGHLGSVPIAGLGYVELTGY